MRIFGDYTVRKLTLPVGLQESRFIKGLPRGGTLKLLYVFFSFPHSVSHQYAKSRLHERSPLSLRLALLGHWNLSANRWPSALDVTNVDLKTKAFRVVDAKTEAGIREVPIHTNLLPTIRRLIGSRKTGYVLAALKPNKFGDRSNAIGKRFGRLKKAAGFGDGHVFHSIRKTVVTLLENAGVSENTAADIVGHEKPRITYGLYSAGATLEVKRAALAKLRYPMSQ